MSERINIDLKSLKFILNNIKPYILPVAVMLLSILVFFQFVTPQLNELFRARDEAQKSLAKLQVFKDNLTILSNINDETLDSQLKTLNSALPSNKDFVGILNSVYSIAQRTGVSLGNFSLKIGDLDEAGDKNNFPVINLSVPVNADIALINSFVESMSKSLPLSEVYAIDISNSSTTVELSFYYKPLGDSKYSQDVRINPISQRGLGIIKQMKDFEDSLPQLLQTSIPISTFSAQ